VTASQYATRYAMLTGLRWLPVGLAAPVLVLLLAARGLDLAVVGRLLALYSVVVVLLELPTGGLADAIGRRPVLVASSALGALGSAALSVSSTVSGLAAGVVLMGAGRALGSGPLEAWYVDAVRAPDPGADITRGISRAQATEGLALGIGALIGGALPTFATEHGIGTGGGAIVPLSIPLLVSAGLFLIDAVVVLVVVEELPRGQRAHPDELSGPTVAGTVARTVSLVVRSPDLRRLMAYAAILGVALSGVELVSPGTFTDLLGGRESASAWFGLLVSLGFGGAALGSLLSPRVARRFTSAPAAASGLALGLALVVAVLSTPLPGVMGACFVVFYLVLGLNGPVLAGLLHDRVSGDERSTVLSVQSLALQLGGIISSVTVGALVAATSPAAGYAALAVALLLGALLLRGVGGRESIAVAA
jgi:MFS family permease